MIPLKDYNPTRTTAVVTLALIVACVAVYFFVQNPDVATAIRGPGSEEALRETHTFTFRRAAIPCEITTGEPISAEELRTQSCDRGGEPIFPEKSVWLAVIVSMFLHGDILHLAGNMLYLWVFGNNIEDSQGRITYLVFYLLSGVAATIAHVVLNVSSPIPIVGASGAIAGVMGAYLVLFPHVPIRSLLVFFLVFIRDIQARWLLGFWFVSQFFINPNSGVAWAAHVGGFVFGVLAGLVWRARRPPRPQPRFAYDVPYA